MSKTRDNAIVPVYGRLIVKGRKKLLDVPENIRDDVGQWLIDNDHYELTKEYV